MQVHLYLSMLPEALIASMLMPDEFGAYYAVGSEKRSHGQAIFFELDPTFRSPFLDIEEGIRRCVPKPDGSSKRSLYISVYRALEFIDLSALLKLYLVTQDGRVLGLDASPELPPDDGANFHLYQEIAPVHPLVVSSLGPTDFHDLIAVNPISLLTLPAVCFAELKLADLANDPDGDVDALPYANIDHLRECLAELSTKTIHTKMVDRIHSAAFPYRALKTGLFIGNTFDLLHFPMLPGDELRARHYTWWRAANM